MAETVAFSGKAFAAHGGNKKHNAKARFGQGDKGIAVVEFTTAGFLERDTASQGEETQLKARIDEVTILTGSEEAEYRQRLADQRQARVDGAGEGQTRLGTGGASPAPDDEYTGLSKTKLKELALERGLAVNGSAKELANRLRAND